MLMMSLSPEQIEIVEHRDGALLVLAGAGSGKTRVLTERVRHLLRNKNGHYRILALTFTNKAGDEMRERLNDIEDLEQKAFVGTLHSFCMELINDRGAVVGFSGKPHIFELASDRREIVRQILIDRPELRRVFDRPDSEIKEKDLDELLAVISRLKRRLMTPDLLAVRSDLDEKQRIKVLIYQDYDELLKAQNALDYDDLLLYAYRILTERPKIAEFYRGLYKYICIDEAQDLNFAQFMKKLFLLHMRVLTKYLLI